MRRLLISSAVLALLAAAPAGATTRLRLDGIGPLKLHMRTAAALRTGWLTHRSRGCELASPVPVAYRISGRRAPRGIAGTATFTRGRLSDLSFTRGVHTRAGVTVGRTSLATMARRYRALGFRATLRYVGTFGGRFVSVYGRGGRPAIGGFGTHRTVTYLAIPAVPACE